MVVSLPRTTDWTFWPLFSVKTRIRLHGLCQQSQGLRGGTSHLRGCDRLVRWCLSARREVAHFVVTSKAAERVASRRNHLRRFEGHGLLVGKPNASHRRRGGRLVRWGGQLIAALSAQIDEWTLSVVPTLLATASHFRRPTECRLGGCGCGVLRIRIDSTALPIGHQGLRGTAPFILKKSTLRWSQPCGRILLCQKAGEHGDAPLSVHNTFRVTPDLGAAML